jgi:hypothetical protein
MMDLLCPIDKKDDAIQKVSAVVAGGTSTGSFSGTTGGHINIDGNTGSIGGFNTLSGGISSNLANLLTPPAKPQMPKSTNLLIIFMAFWGLTFLIGLGGTGILVPLLFLRGDANITVKIVIGVIGIVLALASGIGLIVFMRFLNRIDKDNHKNSQERYLVDKLKWQKAMEKWVCLYYCHKHGVVFDPESGEYCEASSLKELLYK